MKRILTLAALFAAGCAAALTLGTTVASAWDWTSLPNGYSVAGSNLSNGCHDITVNGVHIGSDCDAGFQAALDAYVNSTICTVNPAAGGSACTPTTETAQPTTPPVTVAAPVSTDTTPAAATPPAPTSTETITTTATVTSASSADVTALTDRIAALEQQIAALSARVDRVALAGDAAWLAFQQAVAAGADTATAADLARGTYLNAEYGLGEFAA